MDDEKSGENRRGSLLDEINENFDAAIISVYTGVDPESKSDIDWEDPFFAAVKRSEAQQFADTLEPKPQVHLPTTTTEYEIDQLSS
jgi:hypothetical protein